jgi:hypothetical protein
MFFIALYINMSVTIFKDTGFSGIYAVLGPGLYTGKDLVGCPHQSTSCEEIDNAINSIRVDRNVVVAFAEGHSLKASGARVLVGPVDIPDLAAIGMANKISSIMVIPVREYDSAIPPGPGGVSIYDGYDMMGRRSFLRRGAYTPARLVSEEVKMAGDKIVSITAEAHSLAILYEGPNFDIGSNAVVVVGPTTIDDLDRVGMRGLVKSIQVMYTDPFDTPNRPRLPNGTARDYTPGAMFGFNFGGRMPSTPVVAPVVGVPSPTTPFRQASPTGALERIRLEVEKESQPRLHTHGNYSKKSSFPLMYIFMFIILVMVIIVFGINRSKPFSIREFYEA